MSTEGELVRVKTDENSNETTLPGKDVEFHNIDSNNNNRTDFIKDTGTKSPFKSPQRPEGRQLKTSPIPLKANGELDKVETERRKRLDFLLKQSEIFSHFIANATTKSPVKPKAIRSRSKRVKNPTDHSHGVNEEFGKNKGSSRRYHNISQKENDNDLLDQNQNSEFVYRFESSPSFIKNGVMRDYQVRGLNWMISLYENGINGILADEMGLGKTIQTISLLGYLKHYKNQQGPHIVIAPKSILQNWINEFKKWCPTLRVICLIGEKEERKMFVRNIFEPGNWDVCVTSYEMCVLEKPAIKRFSWNYLVIDEGHRLKNEKTKLSVVLREYKTKRRLMLTGTPLQNNLHELWSLLNFLLPDVFNSSEDFDAWFNDNDCLVDNALVVRLHALLKPFLLRRIKSDVEKSLKPKKETKIFVGLSKLQREWYTKILLKDVEILNNVGNVQKMSLQNILMHLRKCANHPYMFNGAEPGPPFTNDEHLVVNSGKMVVLDKLLRKLQSQGSRVLIFSQFTRMLNILEDYCFLRGYEYCRLDGDTLHDDRNRQIQEYNADNSSKFVFMLSTRAGGLGINLATADVVIIYDSDWNPQMDLQAMDRAHRIGQKKEVRVFRLVTENTVEEKMVERADIKLRLDKLVIQQDRLADSQSIQMNKAELLKIIRFGASHVLASKESEITDEDIDSILERGEVKTLEKNAQYDKMGESGLLNFAVEKNTNSPSSSSVYQFEGEDYRNKRKRNLDGWIDPPKRQCRLNNEEMYKRARIAEQQKKQVAQDFQFYSPAILADQQADNQNDLKDLSATNEQGAEQRQISNTEPLMVLNVKEINSLFPTWTGVHFERFINAIEECGREDIENIANNVKGKTREEVIEYNAVFWKRCHELKNFNTIMDRITAAEIQKREFSREVNEKISYFKLLNSLEYNNQKDMNYTQTADNFLIMGLRQFGADKENVYEELRAAVQSSPQFQFDNFIRSRTALELQQRCNTLMARTENDNIKTENIVFKETEKVEMQKTNEKLADMPGTPQLKPSTSKSVRKRKAKILATDIAPTETASGKRSRQ